MKSLSVLVALGTQAAVQVLAAPVAETETAASLTVRQEDDSARLAWNAEESQWVGHEPQVDPDSLNMDIFPQAEEYPEGTLFTNFSYGDTHFDFGDLSPAVALEDVLNNCAELGCAPDQKFDYMPVYGRNQEQATRHPVTMRVDGSFNFDGLPGNKKQLVELAKIAFDFLVDHDIGSKGPDETWIINQCPPMQVHGCAGFQLMGYDSVVKGNRYNNAKSLTVRVNTDEKGSSGGFLSIVFERVDQDLGGLCGLLTGAGVVGASFGPKDVPALGAISNVGVVMGIICGIATSF